MMQKTGKKLNLLAPNVPLVKAISVSSILVYSFRHGIRVYNIYMYAYVHTYIHLLYMNKCY